MHLFTNQETFYNKGAGFIEYRLKTIRTSVLKPEDKRRSANATTQDPHKADEKASPSELMDTEIEENVSICNICLGLDTCKFFF